MTEPYQHRKPPTFEEEDEKTAAPAPESGAARAGTPTSPAASTASNPSQPLPAASVEPTTEGPPPTTEPEPVPTTPAGTVIVRTASGAQQGRPIEASPAPPSAPTTRGGPPTGVWSRPDRTLVRPYHWVALLIICALALALRLREPLSSPIMGAEDPYLHLERTWNLVQGQFPRDYPVGFMILLAPFTLLGPDTFYTLARYLPAVIGAAMCAGVFVFARHYMVPVGALSASLLLAVMPEVILRTNLLFPTALDLAVAPFIFLVLFRVAEGSRWAIGTLIGMVLAMLLIHPWFVATLVPPLTVFGLLALFGRRERKVWAATGTTAGAIGIVGVLAVFRDWDASRILFDHAWPNLVTFVANPAIAFNEMPLHVNLPAQLTWAGLILAAAGAILAIVHRSRLGLLALLWTFMLLPLTLVDWFGVWYLPHRSVAYLGIGIALLAGIAVAEIVHLTTSGNPRGRAAIMVGCLILIGLVTLPSGMATAPWYRIYDEDHFDAFEALDAMDTGYVMAGSWQARTGYRATTARDADFMPEFFDDENVRNVQLKRHPDMVVLIDHYAVEDGRDTSFLSDWRIVFESNDVTAYQR